MNPPREITKTYQDPLDLIWTQSAKRLGMNLVRSRDVFASWDGQGNLSIGSPEDLDPDDSLAQMIFHEICHAIVQGDACWARENWGLNNTDGRDDVREYACIRLQAALAQAYGLRAFLAVTTDWRYHYDALPADPLTGDDDPAVALAVAAHHRALNGPWASTIQAALQATETIVKATSVFAGPSCLFERPSLDLA